MRDDCNALYEGKFLLRRESFPQLRRCGTDQASGRIFGGARVQAGFTLAVT